MAGAGLVLVARRAADGEAVAFDDAVEAVWSGQAEAGEFEVAARVVNLNDQSYLRKHE